GVHEPTDGHESDAALRSVLAAHGDSGARAEIRRKHGLGGLPLESGRSGFCDAGEGGNAGPLGSDSSNDTMANHENAPEAGRISGGDGFVLRRREEVAVRERVTGKIRFRR